MTKTEWESYEEPKQLRRDIAHLKDWLKKQPHIHARTEDEFLLKFLRGCKYSLERAKEKIDTFYTMRSALPEFFKGRDTMEPLMQEALSLGLMVPLGIDANGRRVALARGGPYDPLKVPVLTGAMAGLMQIETILEEDGVEIGRGFVVIFDMKGMTASQVVHFTPVLLKKFLMVFQNAYPLRPKEIHFLNVPTAIQMFLSLAISFLKDKLKRRVVIHKNIESLHKAVPRKLLPDEYGGSAGPLEDMIGRWWRKMSEKRDFFLNDEQYKVDESKRPGKPKTHEDLFGIEGSFRQLNVD